MITSHKTWDLGSVPSVKATWKTKDLPRDGEYAQWLVLFPWGSACCAHALAHAWGRRGWEQASPHFSHFFLDEAQDLRN